LKKTQKICSVTLYIFCSPINDFGAMALLRQYSLLGLPQTWKASLISSYGSLLMHQASAASVDLPTHFGRHFMRPPPHAGAAAPPLPPPPQMSLHPPPPLPPPPTVSSPPTYRKAAASSPASSRSSPASAASNKQRTYPCNECGKVFNAHYNLTRHMPVHTGTSLAARPGF
jgi:hypothetical protein